MRIISMNDAGTITTSKETYTVGTDGAFEVPDLLGSELTGFPQWEEEYVFRARVAAEKKAHDADPANFFDRLATLEAQMVVLLKRKTRP